MESKDEYEYNIFSKFTDKLNFKYNAYGDICISTDCSSWSKVLMNNMRIDDYFEGENITPSSEFLSFPNFGTKTRTIKKKKESIEDYIDLCECCNGKLDIDRYIHNKKIICIHCMDRINNLCSVCKKNDTIFIEKINDRTIIKKGRKTVYSDTGKNYFIENSESYCKPCYREYIDDEYDMCSNCGIECESDRHNYITMCDDCKLWG
jgi:hypothetical protein